MNLKKLITFMLSSTILLFVYGEKVKPVHGNGLYEGGKAIITDNKINVRSAVGTGGEKLFQLNAGDVVEVIELCREETFADSAYSRWCKIRCKYGTGYVCGRWMTGYFVELEEKKSGKEYLSYEYFYRIFGDEDSDWPDSELCEDHFIRIQAGSMNIVKGISFVPENKDTLFCPPAMELEYGLGLDDNPLILMRTCIRYPSGIFTYAAFCSLDESDTLNEIVTEYSFREGRHYKYAYINFPNKCYDIQNNEWVSRTASKTTDSIVITVEETSYENNQEVVKKREYIPGK